MTHLYNYIRTRTQTSTQTETVSRDSANLESVFNSKLGSKLATIEQIRPYLQREGIQCPGVLVIGAQSSGKSSVLERLTGISFPRGENLCTRFPTIVQVQTDENLEGPVAFVSTDAEFKACPELVDMESIKASIISCSEQHMSNGCKIGDKPIHVRYIRPSGPVMTLIDLPGITHVDTTDGNLDIHSITSGMVHSYVKNENMVILVVIPANDDFGNSEALRLAQKYDAEGSRTIAVVSKCDLVPNKSDILNKIRMTRDSDVKLALGFIAVRNKSADEDSIDIGQEENVLFTTHPVLKNLTENEWGYETLSHKIVELQSKRVNQFILEAGKLIHDKITETRKKLDNLGECPQSTGEYRSEFLSALLDINRYFSTHIRGESEKPKTNIAARTVENAEKFASSVKEKVPDILGENMHNEILGMVKESSGYSLPNFISDTTIRKKLFHIFFRDNIPSNMDVLISETAELMTTVFDDIVDGFIVLQKFPNLAEHMRTKYLEIIEESRQSVSKLIEVIVRSEKSQLFTLSPHYLSRINYMKKEIMSKSNRNIKHGKENNSRFNEGLDGGKTNSHPVEYVHSHITEALAIFRDALFPSTSLQTASKLYHEGGDHQTVVEVQVSLQVYSDVLMNRLFDIIPMVVRDVMIYQVHEGKNFITKMQSEASDDVLAHCFQEHPKVRQDRKRYADTLEHMREAQLKLKLLK